MQSFLKGFTRRPGRLKSRGNWRFAVAAVLLCAGCQSRSVSPGLESQSEDYRTARQHFQTQLTQHGPAPQNGDPLQAPAGAEQVEYSPERHLQAWITQAGGRSGASEKKPAVLFLHGGFAIGADDWETTQPYRDAGFVVMMPVLRGENGQSGDYTMFYEEVNDVLAAADYLEKRPDVDAKRLYVAGHSVGGTLTLLAAMTSSHFRAAASFSGSPDQIAWSRDQPQLIPFSPSRLQEFQMRSPVAFAASFKCPTRLYYGSQESLFAEASQQTAARAKQKGRDVEAVQIPGDHFSEVPEAMRQSISFFQSR